MHSHEKTGENFEQCHYGVTKRAVFIMRAKFDLDLFFRKRFLFLVLTFQNRRPHFFRQIADSEFDTVRLLDSKKNFISKRKKST